MTNQLQSGARRFHPLDLLLQLSYLSLIQTLLLSIMSGEFSEAMDFLEEEGSPFLYAALGFNGFLAFFLNVASFVANKKTSAVSMSVAGICPSFLQLIETHLRILKAM
jgi:hypothetical protein